MESHCRIRLVASGSQLLPYRGHPTGGGMPLNLRRAPAIRGAFFVVVPATFHGQGRDQMRRRRRLGWICPGRRRLRPAALPELGRTGARSSLNDERSVMSVCNALMVSGGHSRVPTLICHREERPLIQSSSRDVAISMRLSTCRRAAVAAATRLPRYARNDTVGRLPTTQWVRSQ